MSSIEPCGCTCCARWLVKFLGRHAGIEGYDAFRILEQRLFELSSLLEARETQINALSLNLQESNPASQISITETPDCGDPE